VPKKRQNHRANLGWQPRNGTARLGHKLGQRRRESSRSTSSGITRSWCSWGGEGGSNNETPATYEQTTGSGGGSPTAPKGWAKQSIWSAWERIKKEVEPTRKVQKVRRKKEVRKMRKIREKKRKQKLFYYVFSYKIILL